ncbi:hypothetical protein Aph02nite_24850 [Actinoplanes philippinensis]|uniref:S1 RNA binding domain-containing protein n=1 Tax=Actinoplanes philippinensis TaxID=35752 RepID=A0A1I2G2X1_9ACTN|nr:S1 RNA-binding domain-containing protein [Actinoplanes philippinensis]GIE76535.1 hypothetical protein Aph02nite_24850 [Actinoplanes philippinensis]SFF11489.1 S1 RNA binding domain-containing protein [Actinoplanes philippinensis]
MRLRMELFVDDLEVSVAFYTGMLGFQVDRRSDGYAALRRGEVVLGFGPAADHPARQPPGQAKGAGVEIVLELDTAEEVSVLYDHCRSRLSTVEALQLRPWGLHDFRLFDPDGYYWRVTHAGPPPRGAVVRGTVSEVHNFGVFVRLDGDLPSDSTGTGFIRVPEVTWDHIDNVADVVHAGQRISAEVLDFDADRGQVQLSLKALQPDPLVAFAERVGEVLRGPVVKVAPFGVFVRVMPGIAGLVHGSVLPRMPAMGEVVTVRIAEVDRTRRQVRLEPAGEPGDE